LKDIVLIIFGTVGFVAGTFVSVENIIAGTKDAGK
jgi:hypothetical protein